MFVIQNLVAFSCEMRPVAGSKRLSRQQPQVQPNVVVQSINFVALLSTSLTFLPEFIAGATKAFQLVTLLPISFDFLTTTNQIYIAFFWTLRDALLNMLTDRRTKN